MSISTVTQNISIVISFLALCLTGYNLFRLSTSEKRARQIEEFKERYQNPSQVICGHFKDISNNLHFLINSKNFDIDFRKCEDNFVVAKSEFEELINEIVSDKRYSNQFQIDYGNDDIDKMVDYINDIKDMSDDELREAKIKNASYRSKSIAVDLKRYIFLAKNSI